MNSVKLNGDKNILRKFTENDVNKWLPLMRIKITSEGLPFNDYRGVTFIKVYSLNLNNIKFKEYAMVVTTASDIDSNPNIKLYDINKEMTYIECAIENNGGYSTLYVKVKNKYDYFTYQICYSPYPSFIERLTSYDTKETLINQIQAINYCNNHAVNWREISLASRWSKETSYLERYEFKEGEYYIELYIKGGNMENGTIIATVLTPPKKTLFFEGLCKHEDGSVSTCILELGVDRNIKIYGCINNNLLRVKLNYNIYI